MISIKVNGWKTFLDVEDGVTLRAFKFLVFKIFKTIKKKSSKIRRYLKFDFTHLHFLNFPMELLIFLILIGILHD